MFCVSVTMGNPIRHMIETHVYPLHINIEKILLTQEQIFLPEIIFKFTIRYGRGIIENEGFNLI